MAPSLCTTPALHPLANICFTQTVTLMRSQCFQAQGKVANGALLSCTKRNQMLVRHLARVGQRLTGKHVSGAATAISSHDWKAPAPISLELQKSKKEARIVSSANGKSHLTKPSGWERKGEDGNISPTSGHGERSSDRESPPASRATEKVAVRDGEKSGSVADTLAQARERLKKASGKHRERLPETREANGSGVSGAVSQESRVAATTSCRTPVGANGKQHSILGASLETKGLSQRGVNGAAFQADMSADSTSENRDQEVLTSLWNERQLPPMELSSRSKGPRVAGPAELKDAWVHSSLSTRRIHTGPPKEGQSVLTNDDKQHTASSQDRKLPPPLKLRPRSLLKKSSDVQNGQALGGLHPGAQVASGGRLAPNESVYELSHSSKSFAESRGRLQQEEELPSPFSVSEESTSSAPVTEWRQAWRDASSKPLKLPPFFREAPALDGTAQSLEDLSLDKDAPLTEWLATSDDASEVGVSAASFRLDKIGLGGMSSNQRAEAYPRTEIFEPLPEFRRSAVDQEAAPLTEWLTQQDSPEAVSSYRQALALEDSAPLTGWRSEAAVEQANGRAANQNGTKSQASYGALSAHPISENGSPSERKVLSDPFSGEEMRLAEAATLVKEIASDKEEQQRTPEWHALRKWRLTASAFGNAVGCWPDGRLRLWEEKLELREPFRGNDATAWGTSREPSAIEQYVCVTGNKVSHQSFRIYKEHDDVYGWLGASPDGLIESDSAGLGRGSGVLEVKCPFGKGRPQAAQPYDSVPYYYIPQVQGLLEIFDRQWADVFIWTVNGSVVYRVERSREYWALLFPVLSEFWWQHVIPAKHEMLQGRTDPAYLRNFEPREEHPDTKIIVAESRRLSATSPAIWTDLGRVQRRAPNRAS